MTKTKMHLHQTPFRAIQSGDKKFEVRLFDEKRQALNVGDVVAFALRPDGVEKIEKEIVALHRFDTFADFYVLHPEELAISDARDFYAKEDEEKYGIVAIELK